jgi:hypothetical protein
MPDSHAAVLACQHSGKFRMDPSPVVGRWFDGSPFVMRFRASKSFASGRPPRLGS